MPATTRRNPVPWVIALGFLGLVFDGYDLVVYGTVLPRLLDDPTQIGHLTPAQGGNLGSVALIGVFVGALLAGTVSDVIGRRKLMLTAYALFALAMGFTALTHSTTTFGLGRFIAGLGIGTLLGTTGALVSEVAPAGKKNLYNALTYSGIAVGSTLAALVAILFLDDIGWRWMFAIGALPLVTIFPLAIVMLPESKEWLEARARVRAARASGGTAAQTPSPGTAVAAKRVGFAGLFSGGNALPAVLLGFTSVCCLLLVYMLNTWLPVLMGRAGFTTKGSLSFLLVLNGSAVVGQLIGSRLADRFGPKPVIATSFLLGAVALALLTVSAPLGVLLLFVAVAGIGTSGTQTLIYGYVANHFRVIVRGAAVAWCAGFGRLGGIGGPIIGGALVTAGLALGPIFYLLAGIALLGAVLTLLVPASRATAEPAALGGGAPATGNAVATDAPPAR